MTLTLNRVWRDKLIKNYCPSTGVDLVSPSYFNEEGEIEQKSKIGKDIRKDHGQ